ncbi:MAG: CvpA family protein [Bacteroidota bacterium]
MEDTYVVNPLDLIIIGVILFGMIRGSSKGLFGISTTVISVVVAVIFGFRFRFWVESIYLGMDIKLSPEGLAFLSFVTAFVVGYILVSSILRLLTDTLSKINIGIDKALGAIFGGTMATIALSLVLFALSFVGFPSQENAKGSITYGYVQNFARYTLGLIPKALKAANEQIQKYGKEFVPPPEEDQQGDTQEAPAPTDSEKPRAIR